MTIRDEIRITAELAARPLRSVDLAVENKIMHALAARLSDDPQILLQELVDKACVLCDAGSCGVSLLELQPEGTTLFRWVAMGGAYVGYVGGATPIDFSPCGDTMRHNAPQLFSRPARCFDYLGAADPELVEGLVIPLPGVDGTPSAGTIWIAAHDDTRKFDLEDVRLMTSIASFTAAALRMQDLLVAERQARQAADAANAAKTAFLADISHEIRTPMNAIIGLGEILGRTAPLTDKQQAFIQTLRSSGHQMMNLINGVLDLAKIEAGGIDLEDEPFCLNAVVDEVTAMVAVAAGEKGVEVFVSPRDVGDSWFRGDALRIRQVLTNLSGNAVKFTAQGCVKIGVRRLSGHDDAMARVELTVTDTGVGIAPEKLSVIFEKFNQGNADIARQYGGTGLGLPISAGLISHMGGTIAVASTPGEGTVFTVILPLTVHKVQAQQHATAE